MDTKNEENNVKYVIGIPALCGDGVMLEDDGLCLFDTLEEAMVEVDDDELDSDLYAAPVAQNSEGDWVGCEDDINWSDVARQQVSH